jgi:hypothetical protein
VQRSPDFRVDALSGRYVWLRRETERLDGMLCAYAAAVPEEPAAMPVVAALNHYAMSDRTACGCGTCAEWRGRVNELVSALRFVPEGHRWSVCACPYCRFVGRIQLNCVAASNVRDLLIEISYHAAYHSRHGEKVMAWLEQELRRPRYTTDWCAYELGRRPVDEWLTLAEAALSPIVSGTVFVPGDGEQESAFQMFGGSQLGADHSMVQMEAV